MRSTVGQPWPDTADRTIEPRHREVLGHIGLALGRRGYHPWVTTPSATLRWAAAA